MLSWFGTFLDQPVQFGAFTPYLASNMSFLVIHAKLLGCYVNAGKFANLSWG